MVVLLERLISLLTRSSSIASNVWVLLGFANLWLYNHSPQMLGFENLYFASSNHICVRVSCALDFCECLVYWTLLHSSCWYIYVNIYLWMWMISLVLYDHIWTRRHTLIYIYIYGVNDEIQKSLLITNGYTHHYHGWEIPPDHSWMFAALSDSVLSPWMLFVMWLVLTPSICGAHCDVCLLDDIIYIYNDISMLRWMMSLKIHLWSHFYVDLYVYMSKLDYPCFSQHIYIYVLMWMMSSKKILTTCTNHIYTWPYMCILFCLGCLWMASLLSASSLWKAFADAACVSLRSMLLCVCAMWMAFLFLCFCASLCCYVDGLFAADVCASLCSYLLCFYAALSFPWWLGCWRLDSL